jgi:myo-inositol-hexaphosphate 3-phosphohydrolase
MISKDLVNVSVLSLTALMVGVLLISSLPSVIAQGMGNNETELIMNQTMNNQTDAAIMNNETAAMSNHTEMTNATTTTATPVNETENPIVDTLKDMFGR